MKTPESQKDNKTTNNDYKTKTLNHTKNFNIYLFLHTCFQSQLILLQKQKKVLQAERELLMEKKKLEREYKSMVCIPVVLLVP